MESGWRELCSSLPLALAQSTPPKRKKTNEVRETQLPLCPLGTTVGSLGVARVEHRLCDCATAIFRMNRQRLSRRVNSTLTPTVWTAGRLLGSLLIQPPHPPVVFCLRYVQPTLSMLHQDWLDSTHTSVWERTREKHVETGGVFFLLF